VLGLKKLLNEGLKTDRPPLPAAFVGEVIKLGKGYGKQKS
jgi:hypothetical protein